MKKIILLLLSIILLTGCRTNMETPTSVVESYLKKYQDMDSSLEKNLEKIMDREKLEDEQKSKYKSTLEKQYQNLSYKIKNEDIEDDKATVDVEIEVLDYGNTNKKSLKYFQEHQDEFVKEKVDNDKIEELKEYIEYKIEELSKTDEKIKYSMTFNLTKEDDKWVIEDVEENDLLKFYGLY